MARRSREKEQKQQHINGAENILLKGCTHTHTQRVQKRKDFFCSHTKDLVYGTLVRSLEDLIAQISVATGSFIDMLGIFQKVRNSLQCPCQVCLTSSGISLCCKITLPSSWNRYQSIGDNTLGDPKFLGYFQQDTPIFQKADESTT
ncbi:hypothetical protein TNCV_2134431 [Trichonephila clavipes]|nr:hypothetical protein TNCV_2134431 [Trichonephila clavipes]